MATLRLGLRVVIRPLQNKKHGLAAESRSPRAPGPRPTSSGRAPHAALAVNAAPGSLPAQHFLHYFSEEVSPGEFGIRTAEKTPSPTLRE